MRESQREPAALRAGRSTHWR